MACEIGKIGIAHLHAVEETLRYIEKHGDKTTYEGLVRHLSWYWNDANIKKPFKPQGWMFEWIRCLAGEDL